MSYRWMKKSVVLSVLFLLALPVVAFAQTSRLEGMTLQGDYVKDYTSIYTYPSQVPNVGNLVYGEVGNTNNSTGGVGGFIVPISLSDRAIGSVLGNLFDGRYGVWGIHLRQTTPNLGQGDNSNGPTAGAIGADPNTNNNESIDLMWGKKMGTSSIGLRYNRSYYKSEVNAPAVTTTLAFDPSATLFGANAQNVARNINGFGGGVSFETNPNSTIEASILYQSRTWENTTNPVGAATNGKEDGPTSYLFSARAMYQVQSNVMVTPVLKYYSYDLSRKSITTAGTTTFDNNLKGWQVGAAANWSLGSNDLLVWGLDFDQNKVEQQEKQISIPGDTTTYSTITENISPRIFAALETHVNSWLTLRMGASKGFYNTLKGESKFVPGLTVKTTSSSFDMNLGAGVKVGTMQFDAVLASNAYQYANGLLGGATPAGGFFPKVTATYSF